MEGYIKLHRKILTWEWYDEVNTFKLWIHLLLVVNHEDNKWRGEVIKRGSTVTSYAQLSAQTGLTIQEVRTALKNLQKTGEVTKVTTSKNTVIIVTNYDKYQEANKQTNNQSTDEITKCQQSANKQTNNQSTTNKNDKNIKNDKNDKNNNIIPYQKIVDLYHEICTRLPRVLKITDNRKKSIGARFKAYDYKLEVFEELFDKANDSDFLCGMNSNKWKANFDWLMNEQNMTKVLEDKYKNKNEDPWSFLKEVD